MAVKKTRRSHGIPTRQARDRPAGSGEAGKAGDSYNRSLIEASPDPLVTISTDGKITDVNAATIRITGYPAEKLIGTRFSDYFTEPQKAEEGYELVFRKGVVRDYPLEIRNRDGGITPVLYNASVYLDESGQVAGVFAAARDITDLKRVEDELRKAGAYNRSLIEAALDPLVTISPEGKITDVNAATVKITGFSRKKLIGTDFSDYFTDQVAAKAGYNKAFQEGSVRDYELRIRHRTGREIPVLYNASVYRDGSGQVAGVFAAARDISERKKAEEEQARLAAIVENSEDAIIGKTLDGTILSWNAGAQRMYGYTPAEAIGRNVSILIPPDNKDDLEFILKRVKKGSPLLHFESMRVRKDGAAIPVSLTVSPIRDHDGNLIGASTIARDISAQKSAEEMIRRSERYNRSLIDASLDPLVTITADGTISDVNDAAVLATGLPREELIGTDFSEYFTDPDAARAGYEKVFREGSVRDYELTLCHRDGKTTPVLYNASVFRDGAGRIAGVFAAARDITERKRAEEEIRAANAYNRSLIEASLDPLVTIRADGTISDVNEATTRATGLSRETLIGTDFSGYFTRPDLAKAGYERVFQDGEVKDYALEIRHSDGRTIPVLYNASLYRDGEGKGTGVFAAARDVTDLRKAEDALKRLNSELEEKVKERTAELREANRNLKTEVAERIKAEEEARNKNEELNAINGELTATQEELRQTNDELGRSEQSLIRRNEELNAINEELTATQEELQQNNEELLKAERELRETGQYLDNLINYANAPIIVWNPQLRITRFNRAFERLTGLTADSVIGRSLDLLFPDDQKAAMMGKIRRTLTGEQWESAEIPIQGADRDVKTILWNSATIFRPDGKSVMSVIAQGQDITGRKLAEEELARKNDDLNAINEELTATQEELRQNLDELTRAEAAVRETSQELGNLIEYANAPVIVWDPGFRITRFNHAFEKLTGRTANEVLGKTIGILFPEPQREGQMTAILRTLGGERWENVEIPILHASGEVRTVLWNSATLYADDGKTVSSVIAQGQDITARKHAEADLVKKNEELTEIQEELRQNIDELAASERLLRQNEAELKETLAEKDILLAEIHHRVKNNLTALISLLSLEGGHDETVASQALKTDLQNRARSMALIHETLYRTKKFAEVDMGVYLKNLIDQMQASLPSAVPVRTIIDADNVMLDIPRATPCGLIVNELVTNSFKYAFPPAFDCRQVRGEQPTIIIDLALDESMYTLTYRDNGVGLPEGFDPTTAQSLGLKLVNFLAKHQMRATIDTDTKNGTEYTFRFKKSMM